MFSRSNSGWRIISPYLFEKCHKVTAVVRALVVRALWVAWYPDYDFIRYLFIYFDCMAET